MHNFVPRKIIYISELITLNNKLIFTSAKKKDKVK